MTKKNLSILLALNAVEEHLSGANIDWQDVARVLREALDDRNNNDMTDNRKKTDRINIRINPELKADFEKYLEETGRTMSWLVTKWIREELQGGKSKSEAKAARENGKKGGRPRKSE